MIKIQNLSKVYKSKKKSECIALNDINLTLPDKGLVFVLGKSGSGKSTLLNLIGGLDNISQGSIIVDGNDISNFNEKKYCDYRNTHIGFIFQDYHLIDELTVYDNICLSLNLRRIEDKDLVKNALKKVDLANYENRFPNELSGGERQRVAIARAIVKTPRIILADEPTGNLDTVTSKQIIELLKSLAKECLVLIVSHNINDADKYADRIIELSKGKIIEDRSKNLDYKEDVFLLDNNIYYPKDSILNDKDIELINENKDKQIIKINDKYHPTIIKDIEAEKIEIENKKLSIKESIKLSLNFLKNKIFRIFFSSFMVSVIMVILALSQTIITFDSGKVIANEMNKMGQTSLIFEKGIPDEVTENLSYKYYAEVPKSDIQKFQESGYKGNIHEVLNYDIPIRYSTNFAGWERPYFNDSLYIIETLGTIIVDEEFLINKFGKLEYVAKLDEFHPSGVLITDYVADALILTSTYHKGKTYNEILKETYFGSAYASRGYINGIIKTNYKEKYKTLFESVALGKIENIGELYNNNEFQKFADEVYSLLGLCYSFNKDFIQSNIENETYGMMWHYGLTINNSPCYNHVAPQIWRASDLGTVLNDNEVIMNYVNYNETFNTEYTQNNLNTFEPHTILLSQHRFCDYKFENPLFTKEVTIKKLKESGNYTFIVSDDIYEEFKKNLIFTKGLYLDGNENIDKVIEISNELNYNQRNIMVEAIHTMTKAVDVFIPIFRLIALFLCAGIIFILVNFSTKMIKDKMHDIGILKALGTQNKSIGSVFGLQIGLIALLTIIVSTIGYLLFIDLANTVLIASLRELAKSMIILDLKFLTFKGIVVLINSLLIVLLTVLSLIAPLLKIRSIKPVKIIKTKE